MAEQSLKKCFVISPIGDADSDIRIAADFFLEDIVKAALNDRFVVTRADMYSNVGNITNQVIEAIHEADLIVADLTGRNANVYYELGVAHTFGRHVVPMITLGEPAIPFDNYAERTISFSLKTVQSKATARSELVAAVKATLNKPVSNPVTNALGLAKAASGDDTQQLIANLVNQVATLGRRVEEHDRVWMRELAALTSPLTSNAIRAALLEPRAGVGPPINALTLAQSIDLLTERYKSPFDPSPPTGAINTLAQNPRPKSPDKK
jgi:hypothetical protein